MEEKEVKNIYAIPANYTDSGKPQLRTVGPKYGKLLGGMIEPRNAVETAILLILAGYPELMWIPMPGTIRIVVMVVTLMPLAVLSVMGIDGDSLFQFVSHIVRFWFKRRKLHMRRVGYKYDQACLKKAKGRKT